jgi:hypothetical protein
VANQPQCKVDFLAVPGVAIIGYSHARSSWQFHAILGQKEFDRN